MKIRVRAERQSWARGEGVFQLEPEDADKFRDAGSDDSRRHAIVGDALLAGAEDLLTWVGTDDDLYVLSFDVVEEDEMEQP